MIPESGLDVAMDFDSLAKVDSILKPAVAVLDPPQDFSRPVQSFPARCTFATGFIIEKVIGPFGDADDAGGVIEDYHAGRIEDLDEAHAAGGKRLQPFLITKGRNVDADIHRHLQRQSTFGNLNFLAVYGDLHHVTFAFLGLLI